MQQIAMNVIVHDPEPVEGKPGTFVTRLTHPTIGGNLEFEHGEDREPFLAAIRVEVDPVGSLFENLRKLTG